MMYANSITQETKLEDIGSWNNGVWKWNLLWQRIV